MKDKQSCKNISSSILKTLLIYSAFFLIPIVIIFISSIFSVRNQAVENWKSKIHLESQKQLSLFNEQLNILQKAVANYQMNPNFYISNGKHDTLFSMDVQNILTEDSMWLSFCSGVYYYNASQKFVISSRGQESLAFFTQNILFPIIDDSSFTPQTSEVMKGFSRQYNEDILLFVYPLERDYHSNQPISFLLCCILKSTFQNFFQPDMIEHSSDIVLFYKDIPIYSSQNGVASVFSKNQSRSDAIMRNGTSYIYEEGNMKLQWTIPNSAYYREIFKAIVYMTILSFIIILVDGWLLYRFTGKKIQPIQHLMKVIPTQYLKHSDIMDTIQNAFTGLLYEKNFLEKRNLALRKEGVLCRILENGANIGTPLYADAISLGFRIDSSNFLCLGLRDILENQSSFEKLKEIDSMSSGLFIYDYYSSKGYYYYLICFNKEREGVFSLLKECGIQSDKGKISIGTVADSPGKIWESYRNVQEDLEGSIMEHHAENNSHFPELELNTLEEALLEKNIEKAELALKILFETIPLRSSVVQMEIYIETLRTIFYRNRTRFVSFISSTTDISPEHLIFKLKQAFAEFKASLPQPEDVKNSTNRSIAQMKQYIQHNYANPDFSLKMMSTDFRVSQSNLSHYFKKHTGQNFSQYVEQLRMERARELLGTGKKINDISSELGYVTNSAFTETFKKYHGMTPREYRHSLQQ